MAKEPFYGVGVNDTLDVLPDVVSDSVMLLELPADLSVQQRLIGHQVGFRVNVLSQSLAEADTCQLPTADSVNLSTTLHQSDDRRLVTHLLIHRAACAYVRFISFYHSGKHLLLLCLKQFSDLLCHAPSRLVGNSKLAFKLLCRNSVAGIGKEENSEEPAFEGCIRLVEDRAAHWMNLITAVLADVALAVLQPMEAGVFLAMGAGF